MGHFQLMMIDITEAVSEKMDAQKQFKTVCKPGGKKARDESQYLYLQQALSGNEYAGNFDFPSKLFHLID